MRVLMLSWEYPPHVVGGMGKHVLDLAPALVQRGVQVHVVTPLLRGGADRELNQDGVYVHRVFPPPMDAYGFVSYVQQANGMMELAARQIYSEFGDFQIIHAHDWLAANAGIALKHAWRRPLIATIHATERGRQQGYVGSAHAEQVNSIEWWLTYEAWRVIACSHFMAEQISAYFNTPRDKVDVVPNGIYIAPNPFESAAERLEFRRRFVEDDQPLVYYVGRLVYEKGLHVLLDAWPQVRAAFPRARLLIAGTGAYAEALKSRAWSLGLASDVTFAGFISDEDRDKLYRVSDLAVFPSLYEPFGIVALEAAATGIPLATSHVGGLGEAVIDGQTGVVFPPRDVGALADGVRRVLDDPAAAQQRAVAARERLTSDFAWPTVAEHTAEVYLSAKRGERNPQPRRMIVERPLPDYG